MNQPVNTTRCHSDSNPRLAFSHLGYIDLSKRRVSPDDVIKCEERYNKSKAVHSILAHVAGKLSGGSDTSAPEASEKKLEEMYEAVAWPLDKKFGHSYDAFKLAVSEPNVVFGGMTIDPIVLKELQANIARRLTPQPVKIRADVEVTCFGYEGIDAIKKALLKAEALSTDVIPIKVKLVAPPLYVLVSHSTDKLGGIALLEQALKEVETEIKKDGGAVTVKMMVSDYGSRAKRGLCEHVSAHDKSNFAFLALTPTAKDSVRSGRPGIGTAYGSFRKGKRRGGRRRGLRGRVMCACM